MKPWTRRGLSCAKRPPRDASNSSKKVKQKHSKLEMTMVTTAEGGQSEQAYHDLAAQLLDRLQERGEWYNALVHVALDAAHGNLAQALEWADQAYAKHPQELADVTEAGVGAVTSGNTANVNVVQTDVTEAVAQVGFTGFVTDSLGRD